ncbi:MAG: hypothetical protein WC959_09115 [Kiritimatiellales bacterium]
MKMTVRTFNAVGMNKFRKFLEMLQDCGDTPIPFEYLEDITLTTSLDGFSEIDRDIMFSSRLAAGKYFCEVLGGINARVRKIPELWAWLSLAYFDQVCPVSTTGVRKPGQICGYIPSSKYTEYYRHKLLGPYSLFELHGEFASALLSNPVSIVGEINEQLASRQEIVSNKEMMKAVHKLYYDEELQTFKRGATTRKKAGSVDRFWRVKEQLDLTYDFFSMTRDDILHLFPREFDLWWKDGAGHNTDS